MATFKARPNLTRDWRLLIPGSRLLVYTVVEGREIGLALSPYNSQRKMKVVELPCACLKSLPLAITMNSFSFLSAGVGSTRLHSREMVEQLKSRIATWTAREHPTRFVGDDCGCQCTPSTVIIQRGSRSKPRTRPRVATWIAGTTGSCQLREMLRIPCQQW